VNFYGKPVMRQVVFKAFFQQIYSQNADRFVMLMQVPGAADYVMNYDMQKRDGKMSIVSNDTELTTAIGAIKEDKRKTKNFIYEVSSNQVFLAKLLGLFE
jgi:hypothetical protein